MKLKAVLPWANILYALNIYTILLNFLNNHTLTFSIEMFLCLPPFKSWLHNQSLIDQIDISANLSQFTWFFLSKFHKFCCLWELSTKGQFECQSKLHFREKIEIRKSKVYEQKKSKNSFRFYLYYFIIKNSQSLKRLKCMLLVFSFFSFKYGSF